MRYALLSTAVLISSCANPLPTLEFSYWKTGEVDSLPGYVTTYPHHACTGDVVVVSSNTIPAKGEWPGVEPEPVLEFDSEGEIVRRWWLPIDTYVQSVNGRNLLIPFDNENSAAISDTGRVELVEIEYQKPEVIPCPTSVLSEISGSSYLRCHIFKDRNDGSSRLIAYQGPCT